MEPKLNFKFIFFISLAIQSKDAFAHADDAGIFIIIPFIFLMWGGYLIARWIPWSKIKKISWKNKDKRS